MNTFTKLLIAGTAALMCMPVVVAADSAPSREHRAIWMTPFLSGNWPSSAITEANAASHKSILTKRLAKFREQNLNIIYYHCRAMCDATYESSYEPWSSNVSGKRGQAPAFDPFGYLIEEAHAVGIEVYAWLNPYRYCSTTKYGEGELNYENSHPDWLISQTKETILNPALEEVKQRIVDVVSEIVTKYDVDGVVFDDYFYTNGTPMSLDAAQYAAYTAAGGKLSQADWRRANVNEMVARVNAAIKKIKPYVTFGISPAGVSSPPNVESEYGLTAAPGGGDWQYNGIYSDPLAWLKAGTIDFISPQIYWPSRFDALSEWWNTAADKFGRHCYPSVDLTDITTYKYAEFAREIEQERSIASSGNAGIVFFQYYNFVNYYERWNGKSTEMGSILAQDAWNTKALVPLRPWVSSTKPDMVSNVNITDKDLTWTANAAGRYAVYKQPKAQSTVALELDGVSYTNNYALGSDADTYEWFVAAYDRYGNLSAPLQVGATPRTGSAPVLTYPADGEHPVDLFDFTWSHNSQLQQYTVEVAEDRNFESVVGLLQVNGDQKASVSALPSLTEGKTYYWRVSAVDVNCEHPVSETRSFVASRIAMTSPAAMASGVSYVNPTLTWTAAVNGAEYLVELSRNSDMSSPVLSQTVATTTFTVPELTLNSGRRYYARVTAMKGDAKSSSDIISFTTVDKTDYAAPTILNPAQAEGQTLHSNETVRIAPWDGMLNVTVQISASSSFPARSLYAGTLTDFATETSALGDIKILSKALVDGTTYYLRARGAYNITTSTATQYTDYTPVYSFVYSSEAGVADITTDNSATWLINATTLHVSDGVDKVTVYTVAGATARVYEAAAGADIDLSDLAAGVYLIKAGQTTLKFVR